MSTVPWMTRRTCDDGGSAVEYGLLAAGVAGLVATIVFMFGDVVADLFVDTCDSVASGSSASTNPISC